MATERASPEPLEQVAQFYERWLRGDLAAEDVLFNIGDLLASADAERPASSMPS